MKSSKFLLLVIICLFNLNAFAAKVTGVVSDGSNPIPGTSIYIKGTNIGVISDFTGAYNINVNTNQTLVFAIIGYQTQEHKIKAQQTTLNITLIPDVVKLDEVVAVGYSTRVKRCVTGAISYQKAAPSYCTAPPIHYMNEVQNTESYATTNQSGFKQVALDPLSTFSIDVDAASYTNLRRYINNGTLPPSDAVRIEEMINYFNYDYPKAKKGVPFSINSEYAACPWNNENYLLHIGLKGSEINMEDLPASNIVFLIDVSGSMSAANKLPLLQTSFKLLLNQLRPQDKVAIVVYAGNSGLVLPSTSANEKQTIIQALDKLSAGGSTAGGAGLDLAYKVAEENYIDGGNNRIILATDGDFNVGQSNNNQLERLIESKRDKGIFISVLGYGMGNYKDDLMETIADKGNGNYSYIDNIKEAKKVLVTEFGGTLFTIAKDVKFQLEFNPTYVEEYRLIGYMNRRLNNEDFEDDQKDAGEMGAGHTVTALYEIVPNKNTTIKRRLKYQNSKRSDKAYTNELLTLKLRYKEPNGNKSRLIEKVVNAMPSEINQTSDNFRYSAAVAQFGMLVRKEDKIPNTTWQSAIEMAISAKGNDEEGYRAEMIQLMKTASLLSEATSHK